MKNRTKAIIHIVAAAAVLALAPELYSQAPAPTPFFSLKLVVTPRNFKTGSDIVMEVDLTNTTNEGKEIAICLGMSVDCNFAIYVRDSRGNLLPQPQPPSVWSLADMSVEPGQTVKFVSNLSKLFDLSRPGRYDIQVERGTVRSNVSRIAVSAR